MSTQTGSTAMTQEFEIRLYPADYSALRKSNYHYSMAEAVGILQTYRWWWVDRKNMILDLFSGQLWMAEISSETYDLEGAKKYCDQLMVSGLKHWRLPTKKELDQAAKVTEFPLRSGRQYRLQQYYRFMVLEGGIDVDEGYWRVELADGHILACNPFFGDTNLEQIVSDCAQRGWSLTAGNKVLAANYEQELSRCIKAVKDYQQDQPMIFDTKQVREYFKSIDYKSVRLPELPELQFTDAHLGLWEFYAPSELSHQTLISGNHFRARNPELDVRDGIVAIDFGTSSTVVALREQGRAELLRIGLENFNLAPEPQHYENPTVLRLVDIPQFMTTWRSRPYRPLTDWDDARCSHQARAELRDNDTDPIVVASVLERLKQWALRGHGHAAVRITDMQGHEHELASLTERNPVRGERLMVDDQYAFDPIELYAWFLGMTINWRSRGIFLNYNMTFPVKYDALTKRKILASFRRGLQRSLPLALTYSPRFHEFSVEEVASEPAAFAASALQAYDIEPTETGVAYAVFDFGGGTTDFDYGFYRLPSEAEAAEGYEHVLEHFNAEGDEFLGGENLLENLAYRVFLNNLELCREKGISFTRPIDAADFPGSEQLVVRTQAAITNTTILMSKLRDFWEKGQLDSSSGTLSLKLLTRLGGEESCSIAIDDEKLMEYLHERIRQGLNNFFAAMKQAFFQQSDTVPQEIQVLLAGNASHSRIVQGFFGLLDSDENEEAKSLNDIMRADLAQIFGHQVPELEIHPPLLNDPEDPYRPNAKTGVALGILELGKGGTLKVINHALHSDESPFQYYVGNFELKKFKVKITRGTPYGGAWVALGRVRDQVFDLPYTQAANSTSNELRRGDLQLREKRLSLPAAQNGHWVFARPAAPEKLELCTAATLDAANAGQGQSLNTLDLAAQR